MEKKFMLKTITWPAVVCLQWSSFYINELIYTLLCLIQKKKKTIVQMVKITLLYGKPWV